MLVEKTGHMAGGNTKRQRGALSRNKEIRQYAAAGTHLDSSGKGYLVARIMQRPFFLYPALILIIAGAVGMALDAWPPLAETLIGIGVLGIIIVLLFLHILRREIFLERQQHRLRQVLADRVRGSVQELISDLQTKGAGQSAEQLKQLEHVYMGLVEQLSTCLHADEVAYTRCLAMGEQVYLAGLNNCNSMLGLMKSIAAMQVEYMDKRILELRRIALPSLAEQKELASLQKRNHLKIIQEGKVVKLLAQNELVLDILEELSKIIRTESEPAEIVTVLEQAQEQLGKMIEQGKRYPKG